MANLRYDSRKRMNAEERMKIIHADMKLRMTHGARSKLRASKYPFALMNEGDILTIEYPNVSANSIVISAREFARNRNLDWRFEIEKVNDIAYNLYRVC